ncbi:MAG TPA: cytochrome d ubiquinol oxidase subunit II [Bacteroidales bacterium]|nr:cytochrome d ubiquinol oxidase subunit II [Bacteroidales bacterium]
MSHLALQHYWWFIISVLGAVLVLLMFVQGGQTLFACLARDNDERTMLINVLGRKWEFTFTTLVTFGGAFFAAFPLFYSTSFGGAYAAWIILLFAFVFQAVSYEFRSRPNNFFGAKTYEVLLFINGLLGTFLVGVVVASFFTGSQFFINDMNESFWQSPLRGVELLFNLHNLMLGLAVFFLARTLGLLYFLNSISDEALESRIRSKVPRNAIPFVVSFLVFFIWLLFRDGFAVNPANGEVFLQANKYLHNFLEMPIVGLLLLAGVVLVLWGIGISIFTKSNKGIWYTGGGTFLAVLNLLLAAGYNNTAFYPSSYDLQSSITIVNGSSSHFTLTVMSYVSLLVPFVIVYIWYAWRSINNKPMTREELKSTDSHIY